MSFQFEWPTFSEAFYSDARLMLEQALNKGTKPPIIADRIEVKELHMGTLPPELEILEIGDLSTDRFRGIFRLTYSGDAYIVLQTKVQANPLNVPRPSLDILGTPRILFAAAPLIVPMTLRLSSLSLRAIVVLVVSRQKGITLVFKNDPLESVNVSSSFDGVESVAGYIQREIEGQLREAFRSDLPGVIHRLSQKWLSGEVKSASAGSPATGVFLGRGKGQGLGFDKDAKIETRTAYADSRTGRGRGLTTRISNPSVAGESVSIASDAETTYSLRSSLPSFSRTPMPQRRLSMSVSSPSHLRDDALQSVPESIESYDPTYGLRPDSIPMHAGFGDYERLVRSTQSGKGLADVLGSSSDEEDEPYDHSAFDMIGLMDLVDDGRSGTVPEWEGSTSMRPLRDDELGSRYSFDSQGAPSVMAGYETIPAVGGGTITRPRIFHTQSQMRKRTASSSSLSAHGSPSNTSTAGPATSTSTIGAGHCRSSPFGFSQTDASGRQEYVNGLLGSSSGSTTPRLQFPRFQPSSFTSTPSLPIPRSTLRSHMMSSSSASQGNTQRSSSRFPSTLASSCSSPPSSVLSPRESDLAEEDGGRPYPPPRPDPIDLLSRSPSSLLNNSFEEDLPITLNPTRSDSCAHLATLTSSNQTLSPFTRNHEHFTARSSPHVISRLGPGAGRGLVPQANWAGGIGDNSLAAAKGVRKRVHRMGSAKLSATSPSLATTVRLATPSTTSRGSPAPSEMSDYFPTLPIGLGAKGPLHNIRKEADRHF